MSWGEFWPLYLQGLLIIFVITLWFAWVTNIINNFSATRINHALAAAQAMGDDGTRFHLKNERA